MRKIFGKQVYETLAEKVGPSHTAIIVVDMQNDLMMPYRRDARGREEANPGWKIVEPLQSLIRAGRQAGVRIVYIQYTTDTNYQSMSPQWIYYSQRYAASHGTYGRNLEVCLEGTWGHQILDELKPGPEDIIVQKHRLGGFWGTNLDSVLRGWRIESVVVTGIATFGCVLDTAVGAAAHDYYTLYVTDCISGGKQHQLGLTFLADRYDGVYSDELITLWTTTAQLLRATE
jgi:nicotinamidase-related amidase